MTGLIKYLVATAITKLKTHLLNALFERQYIQEVSQNVNAMFYTCVFHIVIT